MFAIDTIFATIETAHSIECITHASHSIVFWYFMTLWPRPFHLKLFDGQDVVMDYPCAKFGDSAILDRQTDKQIDR